MHRPRLPTRGQSQTQTDVRFPRPTWPESDNGLAALDPFASGELEHLVSFTDEVALNWKLSRF